ncbi:RNA recognition rrm/rnp domain-like protein [Euroglyphus maynei]|uniref:RNA recognition rrm/rnp domain-like protein n=1 Tax=Euroglyphus maynei TaxID=6958 RepID=A0A1Y3BB74_EURMA|nr:RNA recognition rrm/rnp domain-like protein [Euroglyphus maynei]
MVAQQQPTLSSTVLAQNQLQSNYFAVAAAAAIAEPYNPEDAIFNQTQLMNYRSANLMTNANQLQPNKMRHRHLVNVSLVGNDDDDNSNPSTSNPSNVNHHGLNHHHQQHQDSGLSSSTQNIELTRSCSYGGQLQHQSHQLDQQQKNQQHQNRRNNQRNNNNQQRFDGSSNNNTNKKNRSSTLLIQKIPPHQNRIDLLNDHFQKYGSIVNIKVGCAGMTDAVDGEKLDPESALIQYSSPFEANRAYRSTEPVLNNRFIKVFWARDREQSDGSTSNNCIPSKRKFSSANEITSGGQQQQQQVPQQDLRSEITKNMLKKFKQGPQHQQQEPLPPAKKVVFNAAAVAAARKRRTLLMQRYRQQSDELNRKLRELLLNQRHLMTKLEDLKQHSTDTSKQQQGLKKLIETNMERITEMQQKQLQLQEMVKTTSSENPLTNSATNRVYNNRKKRTVTITADDDDVASAAVDSTDIEKVESNVSSSHCIDKPEEEEDDDEDIIDEEEMTDDDTNDDDDDDDDDDPDEEG